MTQTGPHVGMDGARGKAIFFFEEYTGVILPPQKRLAIDILAIVLISPCIHTLDIFRVQEDNVPLTAEATPCT